MVLYFFNDSLPLSAAAHYLINKFSKEKALYSKKLEASKNKKLQLIDIFKQLLDKMVSSENLSKLELTFLMSILLLIPPAEWMGDVVITSSI